MKLVNTQEIARTGVRNALADRAYGSQESSSLPTLVKPVNHAVYAGDLGPGTWVVEVSSCAVGEMDPHAAVAVLAGSLSPHAYVMPVRAAQRPAPWALRLGA